MLYPSFDPTMQVFLEGAVLSQLSVWFNNTYLQHERTGT